MPQQLLSINSGCACGIRRSTFEHGEKLQANRHLVGLQHIILISSMEEAAWACHRVPAEAQWSALEAWPHGSELRLEGLGLSLGWDEVYAGVGLR